MEWLALNKDRLQKGFCSRASRARIVPDNSLHAPPSMVARWQSFARLYLALAIPCPVLFAYFSICTTLKFKPYHQPLNDQFSGLVAQHQQEHFVLLYHRHLHRCLILNRHLPSKHVLILQGHCQLRLHL